MRVPGGRRRTLAPATCEPTFVPVHLSWSSPDDGKTYIRRDAEGWECGRVERHERPPWPPYWTASVGTRANIGGSYPAVEDARRAAEAAWLSRAPQVRRTPRR